MVIMTPSNENECRQMLYTGYQHDGPAMVRYPRGTGPGVELEQKMTALPIGKGLKLRDGKSIAILCFGTLLQQAQIAAEQLDATLVDMRFVKPIDQTLIEEMAANHDYLITIEDNTIMGGAGAAVIEHLMSKKILKPVLTLGLPDHFIKHGTQKEIYAELLLDADGMVSQIQQYIAS
jgi:1-deoxy-D-xylulose-5-phosphate synthase